MNAAAGGGLMGMIYSQWATKRTFVRPYDIVNGVLGGLVSSSPTSACVQPYQAMIIGAVGGLVACWTNEMLFKNRLKLDDPVGAVGAHAVGATWGILAVGLFADSRFTGITVEDGLFNGGGFHQLGLQCLETVAIIAWSIGVVSPFFWIVGAVISRDPKNPRAGLILVFDDAEEYPHQADPHMHDCREDNIDMNDVKENVRDKSFYDHIQEDVMQMLHEAGVIPNARETPLTGYSSDTSNASHKENGHSPKFVAKRDAKTKTELTVSSVDPWIDDPEAGASSLTKTSVSVRRPTI